MSRGELTAVVVPVVSRRRRVSEGIYEDRFGLAAVVKVRGVQREKRFPFGTKLSFLNSWRIQTRAELDASRTHPRIVRGTLRADGDRFLKRKLGSVGYNAECAHLRAWYPTFGETARAALLTAGGRDAVAEQIARWRQRKVAARTIRHRARVLRECYQALDGADAKHPLIDVALPSIPAPNPIAVPLATMRTVARNLKQSGRQEVYARFLVRASTGQRPSAIMRATPDDLDLTRRIWFVQPVKGGDPVPLPLNDDAVTAWTIFAKANAWGPFDTGREAEILRAHGWPKDIRPYNCRHTFAFDLLEQGADLSDIQGLLGHRQIQTTRIYAPMLIARLTKVVGRRRQKLA